ncbi:MAG: alpha/beta hydrolase [Cyclobacteriaceae bacterium]|nr:alpha/beta hydrolase [Cyclobacteriaceae bacterium]
MRNLVYAVVLLMMFSTYNVQAQDAFELVHFDTEDGGKIEAAYLKADDDTAVIFAHGAIFNKESWYFLAEAFQKRGISALSIDFGGYNNSKAGNTGKKLYDILGAITFLEGKGFSDINIVGGSMGGAAVLGALSYKNTSISKVVLLAPAGGSAIKSRDMDKLFIVSKEEGLYNRVKSIYNDSESPKVMKEYSGNAHAQHMFKTDYADELKALIIDFITSSN